MINDKFSQTIEFMVEGIEGYVKLFLTIGQDCVR
jgi:hypothetical protein